VIAGGETSDFGNGSPGNPLPSQDCGGAPVPIDLHGAEQRGFDVAGERAILEQPFEADLAWLTEQCRGQLGACNTTSVTLTPTLVSGYLVEVRPFRGVPAERCPGVLQYRALVRVSTGDGNVRGAFYTRLRRVESAAGKKFTGTALSDMRNFSGKLPIAVDVARPHWSALSIELEFADGKPAGSLLPYVRYLDDSSLRAAAPRALWPSDSATAEDWSLFDAPATWTLDDYPGSDPVATYRVSMRADSVMPAMPTTVVTTVGSVVTIHDAVVPGAYVELGALEGGTPVSVEVRNTGGGGQVRALTLVDNCIRESDFCEEPDCTARVAFVVSPSLECAN
jgi:hypothetical protein